MYIQPIPKVTIIVAMSQNNIIGAGNTIPWILKSDMKHFKETTDGGVVIMGRKTWESLPKKPLKNRTNVIISNTLSHVEGAKVFTSLNEALIYFSGKVEEVFVIGGGELYKEALPKASKIICTQVGVFIDEGIEFPTIDNTYWKITSFYYLEVTDNDIYLDLPIPEASVSIFERV